MSTVPGKSPSRSAGAGTATWTSGLPAIAPAHAAISSWVTGAGPLTSRMRRPSNPSVRAPAAAAAQSSRVT